ncbi:MAG: type VI secretion system baseplate subunit TssG [Cellvibrionaceae bacterium]|nr:type VI secretion system baseplate subunit TssG [Cellvibrionaceae bacterium]
MSAIDLNNRFDGLPEKDDFFTVVHYLQRIVRHHEETSEDPIHSIGEDLNPKQERFRFHSKNTLGFEVDDVQRVIDEGTHQERYNFSVSFFGLLGATGVLPKHYTRIALEQIKHSDTTLTDFIGMFEHRLISLYYRAWKKYKHAAQIELSETPLSDDISQSLMRLVGSYDQHSLPIFYSGHYTKVNRPLMNLQKMISELVQAKITIKPMTGQWLPINPKDRCLIGINGRHHQLGSGLVLGRRYWDLQSKITIAIADLSMDQYLELLPGKQKSQGLHYAIHTYVPIHISVAVEFKINANTKDVKPIGQGLQLSHNAWLMSTPKSQLVSRYQLDRHHY